MTARAVLIIASIATLAHTSKTEAIHSLDDLPPSFTVVRHKKKAGGGYITSSSPGYLSSTALYADQPKQETEVPKDSEAACTGACRARNIVVNIVLAFLLLGCVNGCAFFCRARDESSMEQPQRRYDLANGDGGTGDVSNPRPRGLHGSGQKADQPEWALQFQPWKLLQVAGSRVGQQVFVLLFLFWEVCTFNSHHHLVLMNCRRDVLGEFVYACEGTKAFARCFPLFAASMALIVTGRYILQFRIYYHFLLKNVLLDFTNHEIKKDLVMMLVLGCFACAALHFALDFFFPPYVTLDKMTVVVTGYFLPCFVFFLLWREASDVEWRLMPLPKLVEEDPQWATEHIAKSQKYLDTSIKHHCKDAERSLYYQKPDHMFELDELLDEIISMSYPATSKFHYEPDHGQVKHGIHGLYKGLWPARILLSPYLKDEESKIFRKAYLTFVAVFIVIQSGLLVALAVSAVQEANDAVVGGIPHDAFLADGEAFEQLGYNGYCRDEGQHRPPGYFISIDKLKDQQNGADVALLMQAEFGRARKLRNQVQSDVEQGKNLCARHCAGNEFCIGFAMDPDLCNIYCSKEVPTPSGWDTLRSIYRMSTEDLSKGSGFHSRHTEWAIVTTDHSMGATCFTKLQQDSEPENFVACAVYLCHILMILWIIYMAASKTFKRHFNAFQRRDL